MYLKNNKGGALILALIVMMVIMLLGTALWQYSMQSVKHASIEEKRMQAHYLARSGAELLISNNNFQISDPLPTFPDAWEYDLEGDSDNIALLNELNGNSFSIKIYQEIGYKAVIKSTGKVGNVSETIFVRIDEANKLHWGNQ